MDAYFVGFAVLVVGFGLSARWLSGWQVTAPIAFLAAGGLLGAAMDAQIPAGGVTALAEATLALILFHDSAQVRPGQIAAERGPVLRLLLLGLPLTIVLEYLVGLVLFPGVGWPLLLLLAAALAPTDAGLGAATVLNPVVPVRVRRVLNVESGLNDGLATPVVMFAIAAAAGAEGLEPSQSVAEAVKELAVGAAVGAVIGAAAGWLATRSRARGWSSPASRAILALVLPLGAYAAAGLVDGNGFIAAFVAGTAYASTSPWLGEESSGLALSEAVSDLLSFAVWFVVGLAASRLLVDVGWREAVFAGLALTLLRMVPVWLSLLGSGFRLQTVAFIGWFGPRGLASVIFALLAIEELDDNPLLSTEIRTILLTVVLSVVLHGISAGPWAERFGKWAQRTQPEEELRSAPEPRARSRMLVRRNARSADSSPTDTVR